jgi:hypothetical protein
MICPHCSKVIYAIKSPKWVSSDEWRDIQGYEGVYQVSKQGGIRRLYSKKIKYIKPQNNQNGYATVRLFHFAEGKTFNAHRLVAKAFIPNPLNLATVNHINGVRNDNRVSNLEWSSYSDNHKHAYAKLGRKLSGRALTQVINSQAA